MNGRWPVPDSPRGSRGGAVWHHGSHRKLLDHFRREQVSSAPVDAIVVPTARSASSLEEAALLAVVNECILVALCSKQSSVGEVELLATEIGANCVAIDVEQVSRGVLPSFGSDKIVTDAKFGRDSDLSFKRNLGLVLSLLAGWRKIVFLDDDLAVPKADDLGRAARLLSEYHAVGLKVDGFPDNSVVCHANRAVGGFQETYIGGGALAVDVRNVNSFFPDIYNEDWFFLLGWPEQRRSAVVGQVLQAAYDPFKNRDRASMEEFGDCLAEGLYALLDVGHSVRHASKEYWAKFLDRRYQLIMEIKESVLKLDMEDWEKDRMVGALLASADRCRSIDPELCVDYLLAWRKDRWDWRAFIKDARRGRGASGDSGPEAAIRALGIADCSTYLPIPVETSIASQ